LTKDTFLSRLREALAEGTLPEVEPISPVPLLAAPAGNLVARFRDALTSLDATSEVVENEIVARLRLLGFLQHEKAGKILGWEESQLPISGLRAALADLQIAYKVPRIDRLPGLGSAEKDLAWLNDYPVSITGADVGIAATGTIILRSGPGRPRVASLVAPLHIVLLRAADIWPTLEFWLSVLRELGQIDQFFGDDVAQQVWISGPSRTADIELVLTLGMHGPRRVHVMIIG